MTHGSLFSGIGGFDLAAAWAGWTNVFNCEIDPFCRRVLKYHFPESKQYEDVQTTDFTVWRDRVDVLTGGFPCQPFSVAGERKGTADDRYLWPAMLRVIRSVQPRWVVGENVYGIVNWSQGLVFEQVCTDLEAAGYEVQAYLIPAAGVGTPTSDTELGLLPTVQTQGLKRCVNRKTEFMPLGLLSTPTACDAKNNSFPPSQTKRKSGVVHDVMISYPSRIGKGSRLSPRYVAQMMGFPPDWTELPFQHGAKDRSKLTATR